METKPISLPVGVESPAAPHVQDPPRADGRADQASTSSDQADLRLIIEEDGHSGQYVYKTVDRRTGDVVQQLPRDEILQMQKRDAYVAGDVVKAKA